MIDYLKQSTFTINEVIIKSWALTKRHYVGISIICFLLFLITWLSKYLASFVSEAPIMVRIFGLILFGSAYLVNYVILYKYIFHLLDSETKAISIADVLPTKVQFWNYLWANLMMVLIFFGCAATVFIFGALIGLPLSFLGFSFYEVSIGIILPLFAIFLIVVWIRLSFFQLFIIDKDIPSFESIKLSLAITRGNFFKIFLFLILLGISQLFALILNYLDLPLTAFFVNIICSMIVVPISAVALTVAYRKMIEGYQGDEHPDIIHNII